MTYKLSDSGWFSQVNGFAVRHHALPASLMAHAGHFIAHHGIEFHVQAGPGRDIYDVEVGRGYPIATWNVDDLGTIRQYNDMFAFADWHGDSVSEYAFGIEHTGDAVHPLKAHQLDASAALCAAIIEVTQARFGETIPLVKVPRISLGNYRSAKGFWDHTDVDNGPLNEAGHVDHLIGRTWTQQLAKIGSYLKGKGLSPAPPFHGTLLQLGVDAPDVVTWKRRMATKERFVLDHNNGPFYGEAIEKSTKLFQKQHKLVVDGIVGPNTWNAAW